MSAEPHPAWLRRALDTVHARYRERLLVADVAATVHVHPAHLAHVFRQAYRVPLGRYIRLLRVEWAAHQLADTDLAISAVAAQAGFADQAHLTRWFRRATGVTPGAFRRARRTNRAGRPVGPPAGNGDATASYAAAGRGSDDSL